MTIQISMQWCSFRIAASHPCPSVPVSLSQSAIPECCSSLLIYPSSCNTRVFFLIIKHGCPTTKLKPDLVRHSGTQSSTSTIILVLFLIHLDSYTTRHSSPL